jgi:hypothetical protein
VAHQVLVGVAQQVVALGAVGAEVEPVEDATSLESRSCISLPAQLALVVEVGLVDDALEVVGLGQPADDLVDLVADLLVALERDHVGEAAALGHLDQGVGGLPAYLSDTYFMNSSVRT